MINLFDRAAELTGASPSEVKVITFLLINYPLANVFIRLPREYPTLKHIFNITIASWYIYSLLPIWGLVQLVGSSILTYYFVKYNNSPRMPWITFGFVMGHLFINHILRTDKSIAQEAYDITGMQMVLTIKLTSFAWNVWDGRRPDHDLDATQRKAKLEQVPSLIPFLGYALFFPAVLVGHGSDIHTYLALVNGTLFKDERYVPRGRKRVAYRRGLFGIVMLGIYSVASPNLNYQKILGYGWMDQPFLVRFLKSQVIGLVQRTKYYGVWKLTEGACIVTGFGFSGYSTSGESTWDGIANVNIPWIELAPNFKVLLDSWNIRTNLWLRECVYKRVTPKGVKPGFKSTIITFLTSAAWHGTYSGYYLTFALGGFVQTAARLVRSNLRPLFLSRVEILPPKLPEALEKLNITLPQPPPTTPKRIYDFFGTLATALMLNFIAVPFCLWYWTDSLEGWRRMDWYGLWMVVMAFAFFYGGGTQLCDYLKKQRIARAKDAIVNELAAETYFHPALRTEDMQGTGLRNLPPVDAIAQEVEELVKKAIEKRSTKKLE